MLCSLSLALLAFAVASPRAETATAKAQQSQAIEMPKRGMSMKQVEKKFGRPIKVLPPVGPTSKFQPPITRWVYDDYIVYFERDLVIHSARPRDPEKFRKLKESAKTGSAP